VYKRQSERSEGSRFFANTQNDERGTTESQKCDEPGLVSPGRAVRVPVT
jgi:hypothetical protein